MIVKQPTIKPIIVFLRLSALGEGNGKGESFMLVDYYSQSPTFKFAVTDQRTD